MGTAAVSPLLERPRLEQRLDEAFGKRLTVVVAGAGFGKTTLVGAWTEELASAWHTVSSQDRALATFAAGVGAAVRPHVGELPDELGGALAGTRETLAHGELLAGLLGEAVEKTAAADVMLVLDDVHELRTSGPSWRFVEALARQAAPQLHLILLSREEPRIRIDRLRGQGRVLELSAAELAFTLEEVEAVLGPLADDDGLAPLVHDATGGWPAAVRLVVEALRRHPAGERRPVLERLHRPGSPLFAYLAREVLERESREVRELIQMVAPLESFTVELCESLGLAGARGAADALVARGLFMTRSGEWLSLHALVREFALVAWPLAVEDERSVHRQAARWHEAQGRLPDALAAFGAASDDAEVARVLETHGQGMLSAGAVEPVVAFARRLPLERRTAVLERLLGEGLTVQGDFDGALDAFERAAGGADRIEPGLAWRMMAPSYLRGDLDRVLATYSRARVDGQGDDDVLLLQCWAARTHYRRGNVDEMRRLVGQALELTRTARDQRALSAFHDVTAMLAMVEGDPQAAHEHWRAALAAAARTGDAVQLGRIHANRGSHFGSVGAYSAALEELESAIRLAEAAGLVGLLAHALLNRGHVRRRLGLLDEANADFEASLDVCRETGGLTSYAWRGLGDIHRERGHVALARAAYEQALRAAEEAKDIPGVESALFQLAKVVVDDDADEAVRLAQRAVAYGWSDEAEALNAAGWVALALGEQARAAELAEAASAAARKREDPFALAESFELAALAAQEPGGDLSRLEEALAIWRELGDRVHIASAELAIARLSRGSEAKAAGDRAERKLRSLGIRVSATGPVGLLRTVAEPPPQPVAIQALGSFHVFRDGIPVALADWQSRKARDLLKILVARRGPAPRDVLMEILWPEVDPARLGNRLAVALSTLRAVLDPERRFGAETFVRADRDAIVLDVDNVLVDVEVFLNESAAGLLADDVERLEYAETCYTGDFLEDSPYEDWAVPLREECRVTYVNVVHALAAKVLAAGDDDTASHYFLRVLAREPHDERAHLGLVSALQRAGRHGEARRAYRAYTRRMDEISVPPAAFPAVRATAL